MLINNAGYGHIQPFEHVPGTRLARRWSSFISSTPCVEACRREPS
ncbi:hypothetical protein [Trinickia mobilis]|nr:hypothetical protein [Trinickia mobilis]